MNRKNKVMEVYGLWFADLLSICISFLLATYIRFGNFKDMGDKGIHFQVCLLFILFCTVYNFCLDWTFTSLVMIINSISGLIFFMFLIPSNQYFFRR